MVTCSVALSISQICALARSANIDGKVWIINFKDTNIPILQDIVFLNRPYLWSLPIHLFEFIQVMILTIRTWFWTSDKSPITDHQVQILSDHNWPLWNATFRICINRLTQIFNDKLIYFLKPSPWLMDMWNMQNQLIHVAVFTWLLGSGNKKHKAIQCTWITISKTMSRMFYFQNPLYFIHTPLPPSKKSA